MEKQIFVMIHGFMVIGKFINRLISNGGYMEDNELPLFEKIREMSDSDISSLLIKLNKYAKYYQFSEIENSNGEQIHDLLEQAINHLKEIDNLLKKINS